jgi:protein-tyrosine-phosphatase
MNIEDIDAVKPQNSKAIVKLLNYYNSNEKNKEISDPWGVSLPL